MRDFECDVQVEIVLFLELEILAVLARHFEEGEAGAILHLVEGVQHARLAAGLRRLDLEGVDEWEAEEVLVELPRLLGVPAAIGVVMQSLDHH
jgi:hypothetical protein